MLIDPNEYGVLKVSGPDAKKFLQGQLTCDIDTLTEKTPLLGAHCNPQGRVISLFQLFLKQENYYLLMLKSMLPIAQAALKKYSVFFKVALSDASETNEIPTDGKHAFDLDAGIPTIYPDTSGKFLPHDINLPALGAVSFHKGCFTGQEIIARMQYRGKLKKHMFRAQASSNSPLSPGAHVYSDINHKIVSGEIVNALQTETKNQYHLLVVSDTSHIKNDHLFLDENAKVFLTILS